jgi:hypothetical protein
MMLLLRVGEDRLKGEPKGAINEVRVGLLG